MASVKKPTISASDAHDLPVSPTAKKKRIDTSLCLLARRLCEMVQASSNKVVDLNEVSQVLSVPKRRLYDVTNVLEGVKLARKTSKNQFQWIGTHCGTLPLVLTDLIEEEKQLDELINFCTREINQMCQNKYIQRFAYLTYEDVQRIPMLKEQTVIVIKGPAGTKLEVPHPKESLQVYLSSTKGPIEAFLCTDEPFPEDNGQAGVLTGNTRSPLSDDHGPPQQSSSAASTLGPPVSTFHQLPTDDQPFQEGIGPPLKVPLEEQQLNETHAEGVTDCLPSADLKPAAMDTSV